MTSPLRPRQIVSGPSIVPNAFGLLSAVDWRPVMDHELLGITWQSRCPAKATTTVDPCFSANLPVASLSQTTFQYQRGALPFTVVAEIDCSPPGFFDNSEAFINEAFTLAEGAAAEFTLQTGTAAATGNAVYPRLAANSQVLDGDSFSQVTLQMAATVVTGVALDIVEGLGRLESALNACLNGLGNIHVTPTLFESMVANYLVQMKGGLPYTYLGNRIIVGLGYVDMAPDHTTAAPGTSWMYGTGPLFGYRGAIRSFPPQQSIDRNVNTLRMIAERDYVIAYDCCLVATEVSLGGVVAGTYNSAQ